MRISSPFRFLALILMFALAGLSACGDDDSGNESHGADDTTGSTTATTDGDEADTDDTTSSTTDTTDDETDGDDNDGASDSEDAGTEETAGASLETFCTEMDRLLGEQPESYVGSAEHLADLNGLLDASPAPVRSEVEVYRDFIEDNGVSSDDPDSSSVENFPADVQEAITKIVDYEEANC